MWPSKLLLMVAVGARPDAEWLGEMAQRAELFKECIVHFPDVVGGEGFPGNGQTCAVPPDVSTAYVHVFKAAGTTLNMEVKASCSELESKAAPLDAREKFANSKNWTLFSFVRDPITRFQSGLEELAWRGDPWLMPIIDQAFERNETVASLAIRDLAAMPTLRSNPHVGIQSMFFTDHDDVVDLSYLGVVNYDLGPQLGALRRTLFNMPYADDVITSYRVDASRHSVGDSEPTLEEWERLESTVGPRGFIHDEELDIATLGLLRAYYAADFTCLGFGHSPKEDQA